MKIKICAIACFMGMAVTITSCTTKNMEKDYAAYVNPFIGTGGHGHTFPGPVVPNGMIQPSPDTRIDGWDASSGYYYEDSTINGFSHTHVSGTGCADYGDILLMPTVGKQTYDPQDYSSQTLPYASEFSHKNETAEPGYYSVFLDRYKVKAELTATKRAALHRYTFPASNEAGFILDMDYSIQHQKNMDMQVDIVSDTEIKGYKLTEYWAFDQQISFYAKFSKPFTYQIVRDTLTDQNGRLQPRCKVLLSFKTQKDEQVMVKMGISAVDTEGAKKNLEAEIPSWEFEQVRSNARQAWNNYLSKIDITTQDENRPQYFLYSNVSYCNQPEPLYRRRRTLLGNGSEGTSGQCRQTDLYGILFMGYFPCAASVIVYHRPATEQRLYPFTSAETSGRWYIPDVGSGIKLYRNYDWLSCCIFDCRRVYQRLC